MTGSHRRRPSPQPTSPPTVIRVGMAFASDARRDANGRVVLTLQVDGYRLELAADPANPDGARAALVGHIEAARLAYRLLREAERAGEAL